MTPTNFVYFLKGFLARSNGALTGTEMVELSSTAHKVTGAPGNQAELRAKELAESIVGMVQITFQEKYSTGFDGFIRNTKVEADEIIKQLEQPAQPLSQLQLDAYDQSGRRMKPNKPFV